MTEVERLEYNEALTDYMHNPTEENKARLEEIKDKIYADINNRWLEDNKVFERQQGNVIIENAKHIVNIGRVEVFNG